MKNVKSLPLTKELKEFIIKQAVCVSGNEQAFTDVIGRRAKWAEAVRMDGFGGAEFYDDFLKKCFALEMAMDDIGRDYLGFGFTCALIKYRFVNVNVAGSRIKMYFNGHDNCDAGRDSECRFVKTEYTLKADHPLSVEFFTLEKEFKKVMEDRINIRKNLESLIFTNKKHKNFVAGMAGGREIIT